MLFSEMVGTVGPDGPEQYDGALTADGTTNYRRGPTEFEERIVITLVHVRQCFYAGRYLRRYLVL